MNKITLKGFNEEIIHEVLNNGLEVFLLPNNKVLNYYATFCTKFGSSVEKYKLGNKTVTLPHGVAHFLEHLTFHMEDGSDASLKFASYGVKSNAYTSYKVTCYEVFGFDHFNEALNDLLDMVQIPYYTEELVENEKGIICEEVKMYEDSPGSILSRNINTSLFKNEPRIHLVTGECEDVNNTTLEDIMNAYNTFYNPANMFIIITGNFNPPEALAIIEKNQSKKDFNSIDNVKVIEQKEPVTVVNKYKEVDANIKIDKVAVSLKLDKKKFQSLNISKVELNNYISIILNSLFGRTSIFKDILVRGNIITDGPSYGKSNLKDVITITITAETPYKEEYLKLLNETLDNIDISEEDFNRKRKCIISSAIQSFDDIEEVNYLIMLDLLEFDHLIADDYDIINNLKYETAKKIAKLLRTNNRSTVILKTKEN